MHSPKVFALAAAEHTDQEGNDDNSTEHPQGDYQRLEVHCTQTKGNTTAKLFRKHAATSVLSGQPYVQVNWSLCGVLQKVICLWPAEDTRLASTFPQLHQNITNQWCCNQNGIYLRLFACNYIAIAASLTYIWRKHFSSKSKPVWQQQEEEVLLNHRATDTCQPTRTVSHFLVFLKLNDCLSLFVNFQNVNILIWILSWNCNTKN